VLVKRLVYIYTSTRINKYSIAAALLYFFLFYYFIRLIKAWQNAGLYNWVIRNTNKNVISKMLYININKMFWSNDG